jgi:hypothetical protein
LIAHLDDGVTNGGWKLLVVIATKLVEIDAIDLEPKGALKANVRDQPGGVKHTYSIKAYQDGGGNQERASPEHKPTSGQVLEVPV